MTNNTSTFTPSPQILEADKKAQALTQSLIPFFPTIAECEPMYLDPESLPQAIYEQEPDNEISPTKHTFVIEQFPELRENIDADPLVEDVLPGLLTSWGPIVASEPAEAEPTIPEVGIDALA